MTELSVLERLRQERDEARALVRELLPYAQDEHDMRDAEAVVRRWDVAAEVARRGPGGEIL